VRPIEYEAAASPTTRIDSVSIACSLACDLAGPSLFSSVTAAVDSAPPGCYATSSATRVASSHLQDRLPPLWLGPAPRVPSGADIVAPSCRALRRATSTRYPVQPDNTHSTDGRPLPRHAARRSPAGLVDVDSRWCITPICRLLTATPNGVDGVRHRLVTEPLPRPSYVWRGVGIASPGRSTFSAGTVQPHQYHEWQAFRLPAGVDAVRWARRLVGDGLALAIGERGRGRGPCFAVSRVMVVVDRSRRAGARRRCPRRRTGNAGQKRSPLVVDPYGGPCSLCGRGCSRLSLPVRDGRSVRGSCCGIPARADAQ